MPRREEYEVVLLGSGKSPSLDGSAAAAVDKGRVRERQRAIVKADVAEHVDA